MIDLPSLERRRFMLGILFVVKLINGDIDSHFLTAKIVYNVPARTTRNFVPLKVKFSRLNYELFNSFNTLLRNYNSVHSLFSTSDPIETIKRLILNSFDL